jgi:hypothetical protein
MDVTARREQRARIYDTAVTIAVGICIIMYYSCLHGFGEGHCFLFSHFHFHKLDMGLKTPSLRENDLQRKTVNVFS